MDLGCFAPHSAMYATKKGTALKTVPLCMYVLWSYVLLLYHYKSFCSTTRVSKS